MALDVPTLMVVSVFVTLIVGLLFLFSWNQGRRTRALAILGAAHLLGAVGSALLCARGLIADWISIGVANALVLAAYGLIWSATRSFDGRPARTGATLAGAALWCGACLVPAFYGSMTARVVLASGLAGAYCALAARETWRGRAERLPSRGPAAALLASEGALYGVRIPLALAFPVGMGTQPAPTPMLALLCFLAILYTVAVAFLFVALGKERLELEQRRAADTDALTGVANRRALQSWAAAQFRRGEATLLLLDLDHFKRINDTWGHGVGDAVLVGFCTAARALLPQDGILGRLGGEEFACLLPGTDRARARQVAEAIRRSTALMRPAALPGFAVTVSIGAATGRDFDALMRRADRALYRAKDLGRDRVVWAEEEAAGPATRRGARIKVGSV
ncbi:GGDEF domain-containing protein [Methylobacterium oryzihabitans]|uniref:diguanylate cyclase n=1 Tax=Methylobacterium oryzihabitans TaxID=2499852 RepID=A0A437NRC2_9HYPH|nr:GGDEF domain-containing protein [Methylobacterium oryzihabitans]RVU12534.1 GGDEF domain-containing protein [Methylobacterium oryzihabitans]